VRIEVFYLGTDGAVKKKRPHPDPGWGRNGLLGSQRRYFAATTFRAMTTARITRIPL
jgi:hypothetical protein